MFVSFIPAVSAKATKTMRSVLRQWKLSHRGDLALEELVRWLQPMVRGWVNYYGRFSPSELYRALSMVDELMVRWAQRKYKGFKGHTMGAWEWLKRLSRNSLLCCHIGNLRPRLDDRSRMSREAQIRFWESAEVKFLRATDSQRARNEVRLYSSPQASLADPGAVPGSAGECLWLP